MRDKRWLDPQALEVAAEPPLTFKGTAQQDPSSPAEAASWDWGRGRVVWEDRVEQESP